MAYNFKSIADVEIVAEPSKSANVLIEENGEIKRAPKTAVGGAGGGLYVSFYSDEWKLTYVPDDLYNTIKEMYSTKIFTPVNLMSYDQKHANFRYMNYIEDRDDHFYIYYDGDYVLEVYSDGTVEFMSYD